MWRDKKGRSHSLEVDEPMEILTPRLRRTILDLVEKDALDVEAEFRPHLAEVFQATDDLEIADEREFKNRPLPAGFVLPDLETQGSLGADLIAAVDATDTRWRLEVYFALIQLLNDVIEPIDED
ncbi:hypothetical protein QT381_15415 [Galbitalea sp. SE-J8]|uniref:hypothetical protein n=1 Tax=Galbitalea sp. SE-J8 TaxID=3054952 RepID=UPI00259C88E2|nr:hypothetical protein [Galbitalea sp. SE-J8]MDM4764388.1 hypothetical protein [Galbitalea sp. SE-J8]